MAGELHVAHRPAPRRRRRRYLGIRRRHAGRRACCAIIGTTHDRTEDTYTVYVQAGFDISAEGGLAFGPRGAGTVGTTGMVAVTVSEDGEPQSLVFSGEATAGLFGQLGTYDGGDDTIFDDLQEQYTDPDNGVGGTQRTEARLALDLTNEDNAEAAYGFLRAAGLSAVGPRSIADADTVGAAGRLAERFYNSGTLSLVDYDVDGTTYGVTAEAQAVAVAGVSSGLDYETAVATRARYWDGQAMVDLPGCIA
ncbi:MAG: hypothetical protein M4D85_05780 [Actinomycetota bacterium]|nr:hypothetical protein [Actinomycetota bacterium]